MMAEVSDHCVFSPMFRRGPTFQCTKCGHAFKRYWNPDELEWSPGEPIPPINVSWACGSCRERLLKLGYTGEKRGGAERREAAPAAHPGVVIEGLNGPGG